ncbi:hypothetical protein Tco_0896790 [Tanacetum coccineum]
MEFGIRDYWEGPLQQRSYGSGNPRQGNHPLWLGGDVGVKREKTGGEWDQGGEKLRGHGRDKGGPMDYGFKKGKEGRKENKEGRKVYPTTLGGGRKGNVRGGKGKDRVTESLSNKCRKGFNELARNRSGWQWEREAMGGRDWGGRTSGGWGRRIGEWGRGTGKNIKFRCFTGGGKFRIAKTVKGYLDDLGEGGGRTPTEGIPTRMETIHHLRRGRNGGGKDWEGRRMETIVREGKSFILTGEEESRQDTVGNKLHRESEGSGGEPGSGTGEKTLGGWRRRRKVRRKFPGRISGKGRKRRTRAKINRKSPRGKGGGNVEWKGNRLGFGKSQFLAKELVGMRRGRGGRRKRDGGNGGGGTGPGLSEGEEVSRAYSKGRKGGMVLHLGLNVKEGRGRFGEEGGPSTPTRGTWKTRWKDWEFTGEEVGLEGTTWGHQKIWGGKMGRIQEWGATGMTLQVYLPGGEMGGETRNGYPGGRKRMAHDNLTGRGITGQVTILGAANSSLQLHLLDSKSSVDQELLQTVRKFHTCKQEEGQSVSSYILKMKSYIDNLERLSHAMTQNLSVSLILVSLRKEYDGLVQNYNMHSMGKTVTELHAMLKLHEQTLPPKEVAHALHAIREERIQKNQKKKSHKATKGNQGKGKAKMGYAPV